jgi:hypothetical protein
VILGRPTNLWLGVVTTFLAVLQIVLVNIAGLDPVLIATLLGAIGVLVGAVIALIANQPPTLTPGDTYSIQTPKGQPNYEATVAPPPAATKPTPDLSPKA